MVTGSNSDILPQGIPLIKDYLNLLRTNLYVEMESFSNSVIKSRWYKHDMFHDWSRRWEYSFAYSHIRHCAISISKFMHPSDKVEILDAGSGFTFFPYYISYKHSNSKVYCCDYDRSLADVFDNVNKITKRPVDFKVYNLENLGYANDFFHIVYCISVLEHTSGHEKIFEELKRVLKPNGLLIVTFDVSLEDKEKGVKVAQIILNKLNSRFKATNASLKTLSISSEHEILTTKFARNFDENSLPWALTWMSMLSKLRKLKVPQRHFSFLTVFCGVWKKQNELSR